LAVFVTVVLATYALVIIPNYSAFDTLYNNNDGMRDGYEYIESTYSLKGLTEFVGDHPEWMSVVSFNINDPDSGIYYQADVERTLGTLSNFFLLVEYERQKEAGLIDPNEMIPYSDIERYSLAQISEEAHKKTFEMLELEPTDSVPLDTLVATLIETNDLAASDLLYFKLGAENIAAIMDTLGVAHTDTPLPFSGLYMSIHPQLADTSKQFSNEDVILLAEQLGQNPTFNDETKAIFKVDRLSLSFIQERDALAKFPQTTPREMANLMASLYKNEIISESISQNVKEKLKWVFEGSAITRSFEDYGAIYDNRMGMLSGIDFGVSIYDGHESAQAVFFDKLPVAFWLYLSANHMQEDYQQRLIWDPALYETTIQEIETSNPAE
jgi:hypothetical protein